MSRHEKRVIPGVLAWLALCVAGCAANPGSGPERVAPPAPIARAHAGFWPAMLALDFDRAATLASQPVEREYLDAVRLVAAGDMERGQASLVRLVATHDIAASPRARLLLSAVVKETASIPDNAFASRVDRSFAEALLEARIRERRALVPTTVPLAHAASGTPRIPVRVNGVPTSLGLDTGAGLTVIGSDLANAVGAKRTGARIAARDAHGDGVSVELATVDLAIGGLRLEGHPVMVIDSARLRFRVAGETVEALEGVLGWNALSALRVVIDNPSATVSLAPSAARAPVPAGDFFWIGEPYVRARAANGLPLTLFLDSGASRTSIASPLAEAAGLRDGVVRESLAMGAGSTRKLTVTSYPGAVLYVGASRVRLGELQALPARDTGYAVRDGVLGADALREGRVTIDFPLREFSVSPAGS